MPHRAQGESDKPLEVKSVAVVGPNDVTYIDGWDLSCHSDHAHTHTDTIGLHRMANEAHSVGAVSLHLYSPPYQV